MTAAGPAPDRIHGAKRVYLEHSKETSWRDLDNLSVGRKLIDPFAEILETGHPQAAHLVYRLSIGIESDLPD